MGDDPSCGPRYGKFVRRKAEGDELERPRAATETAAARE